MLPLLSPIRSVIRVCVCVYSQKPRERKNRRSRIGRKQQRIEIKSQNKTKKNTTKRQPVWRKSNQNSQYNQINASHVSPRYTPHSFARTGYS